MVCRWQVPNWIRSECIYLALSADACTCSMLAHEIQYYGCLVHSMDAPERSLVSRMKMTSALDCDRSERGGRLLMVCAWQVPDWGGSDC